ncbi:efflux RND transporter periplasmic adaptor subunit [Botrimarina mediterranea]|uniref:efflux RND transporter periplasmic adaptor subunit n=1 Tax=Botrimarina mediterranea TaxID=2528022 RepID=UPI0011889A0A|nr:HlyD family secretion protein [Planctomycetes bacterium K2D]
MVRRIIQSLLALGVLSALAAGGWWAYRQEGAIFPVETRPDEPVSANAAGATPTSKVIVSDRAQANLGLTANTLQTGLFWRTVTVPGMIVDRPGMSDREVVAPATGTISDLFHIPGDLVQPGDKLFTLKLASESLQQAQIELFKANENIKLAQARRDRLANAGEGIPGSRIIEIESEIARLRVAAQGYRQELSSRGLSPDIINDVAAGELLSELSIVAPPLAALPGGAAASENPLGYELQQLLVERGEQVQAGQTLCHLSNHQSLAIEGRAFRDEASLLERSVREGWPVEVDFQEENPTDWPTVDREIAIRYIANTIDPATRTFGFMLPLENQHKLIDHDDRTRLLWRYRPGQKVRLRVRVERLDGVFVLPADALVMEGAEAFVFTQNVNTFEKVEVRVLHRDRDQVVLASDGALATYAKGGQQKTLAAVAQTAAAQLNRMTKTSSNDLPEGYHIHADGSLHKNEDEAE